MMPEEIYHALHECFGERIVSCNATAVDPYIVVEASAIHVVGDYLWHDPAMQFYSLMCLSGVDYGPEKTLRVVYNLHSTTLRHKITLKIEVPRHDGAVPTVSDIWHTAEWHERQFITDFRRHRRIHQDLPVLRCATNARRQVHHAADRCVVGTAFIADAPDDRWAFGEAHSEADGMAAGAPVGH